MIRTHFLFLNWMDYFAVHVHVKKIFAVMAINSLNSQNDLVIAFLIIAILHAEEETESQKIK